MEDLFTTRQVQNLLKVDRITIYRMLQDGRIKGVKVGQQWRFTSREVERILAGETTLDEPILQTSNTGFPTHCVQTIQDLFSAVSQIGSMVVDMQGEPLTEISSPCALCSLVQTSPAGMLACKASWQSFVRQSTTGAKFFTCHAGLQNIGAPIYEKGQQLGLFLSGQFYWEPPEAREEAGRIRRLSASYQIPFEDLQQAARSVPVIAREQHGRAEEWPISAARAIQSILQERTSFIDRLQQIANLTQIV
jgi:excisionase family DNA binding protein